MAWDCVDHHVFISIICGYYYVFDRVKKTYQESFSTLLM